jgi:predicted nucleic acid-binding protein
MSDFVVVDSSVAYKWLHPEGEDHVTEALGYLWQHRDGEVVVVAPDTLFVEIANALRNSKLQPAETLDLIDALVSLTIETFESDAKRLRAAAVLSYRHRISVYDALFLALAEELGCPLVSADHRAFGQVDSGVEIRLL